MRRLSGAEAATWLAAVTAALGAILVLVVPAGGLNREAGVAIPLAVAGALMAANALAWRRLGWVGAVLFGAATLACIYAILSALSLPVRVTIASPCPRTASSCPLGYEYPMTGGENFAVYAATATGALAMLLVFVAFEARYLHRRERPLLQGPPQ